MLLEPEELLQVERGSWDVQCEVCRVACRVGLSRAKKANALRDEDQLSEIVSSLCYAVHPDRRGRPSPSPSPSPSP